MRDDNQTGERHRDRVGLTSVGLIAMRRDIDALLDCDTTFNPLKFSGVSGFVGWGLRPSSGRAAFLGQRTGKPVIRFEDGFLKGFRADLGEPPQSYVVDHTGIHIDTARPNDLATLLEQATYSDGERDWARDMIALLRRERLTKFSGQVVKSLTAAGRRPGKPYVLVVDQVATDASIAASGANRARFCEMLKCAANDHANTDIIIRTHPNANASILCAVATEMGISAVIPEPMNPWPLLEEAKAVYTVSSHLGFEALMAGCEVHSFGNSYYSGRGLTKDRAPYVHNSAEVSLETLFIALYRDYSRYLDLH